MTVAVGVIVELLASLPRFAVGGRGGRLMLLTVDVEAGIDPDFLVSNFYLLLSVKSIRSCGALLSSLILYII